jgi:hypothetical protein
MALYDNSEHLPAVYRKSGRSRWTLQDPHSLKNNRHDNTPNCSRMCVDGRRKTGPHFLLLHPDPQPKVSSLLRMGEAVLAFQLSY